MKSIWRHEVREWHAAKASLLFAAAIILILSHSVQSAAQSESTSITQESENRDVEEVVESLKDSARDEENIAPANSESESEFGITEIEINASSTNEFSPDIHVSPAGRVEMHVNDLALSRVLQMLSIQSRRNIVASRAVTGSVTADLYGVNFEEALTAILDSNGCTWRERGNFIYVHTKDELEQLEVSSRPMVERLFRLHYVKASEAKALIEPLLSSEGIVATTPDAESGIASNSDSAGGDTLALGDCIIVVDYPERLDAIERRIEDLDVRPQQVLVEATILRAQLNEDNALGIDFNFLGGVDFEGLNSVSPGVTDLFTGELPRNDMNNTSFTTRTDFNQAVPNGGFTFGIIKNNIALFVRALESVTDTTVLANPKVLTLNKQRGEVIVGRRDGYLTTTVTETAAVQNVEFLETGTQLRFRPFIGHDGYVRMEVHPEDSTGGVNASNLPFEQTTEVTTNILVRDGHTILIGGLFREVDSATRSQVPLIGNLPVAGALFRNTDDSTQREEVIILLTVHIIKDDDVMAEAGKELDEEVERIRVGTRRGMQWFGRERLAQAHYQWALEHIEKGQTDKALWDLDMALNNSPTFTAAMYKKEQLLGTREWEEDSSSIRHFIRRLIMEEKGIVVPPYGRPDMTPMEQSLLGPTGFGLERQTPSGEAPGEQSGESGMILNEGDPSCEEE